MTSLIDNNIDELIKRVRARTAVSDMVFMTAYPPRELANPIEKYTVTVNNTGVKIAQTFIGEAVGFGKRGSLYDVFLTLRVYAPRHTSSAALLRASSLLFDALDGCDSEDAISDLALGEVGYDNAARTYYRDLRVRLSYLLIGEGVR